MRMINFKGFCEALNGKEKIYLNNKQIFGHWVKGDLIHRRLWTADCPIIRTLDSGFDNYEEYCIIPETISECTNIQDINGTEIYENDIIITEPYMTAIIVNDKIKNEEGERYIGVVKYKVYQYDGQTKQKRFNASWSVDFIIETPVIYENFPFDGCEVIGNKFSNPELLKTRSDNNGNI